MLEPDQRDSFDGPFLITRIICASMAASILIFSVLAHVVAGKAAPIESIGTLKTVFYFAAAALIGAALLLNKYLLGRARLANAARKGLGPLMGAVLQAHILLFAIWESSALLGLVLAILSGSATVIWPFILAGALGMAYSWPRTRVWEDRVSSILRNAGA